MRSLLRLLAAAVLAVTVSGLPQAVAAAVEVDDCCEQERSGDTRESCDPDCAACPCCPLRLAGASVPEAEPLPARAVTRALQRADVDEPALTGATADIFQPPRA